MITAVIPSPTQGVWYMGPVPLRAYAICIIIGILVAVWLTERRWVQRGGKPGVVMDIAIWAIPFGIVGGRLYHVVTSWQPYFGRDGNPIQWLTRLRVNEAGVPALRGSPNTATGRPRDALSTEVSGGMLTKHRPPLR